jgi:hypothetical protein
MPYAFGVFDVSQTITTSAVTLLNENRGRRFLFIQNVAPVGDANVVWVNISGDDATEDSAGNIMLVAGAGVVWETDWIPSSAVSLVASENTPVTVLEG